MAANFYLAGQGWLQLAALTLEHFQPDWNRPS
jgi:hypothetical protein